MTRCFARSDASVKAVEESDPRVSLCLDCARQPSLKRIIEQDSIVGLCAFCGRRDAKVRNPGNAEPMIMLIRSLIRYYWDEFEYNHHWGGESVMDLFAHDDNPVVKPASTDQYLDLFDEFLGWPPYPDRDKGVSVYAGSDGDGLRHLTFAISRTNPEQFGELQHRLLGENFIEVEPALGAMIDPFLADITVDLPANDLWFRARLGHKATYQSAGLGWTKTVQYQPWLGKEIGAPPPLNAGFGRLNRAGVSMLYLASDSDTAIAEIRPHPGHLVSLGGFRTREPIRVADFNPDIGLFSANENRLDLFAIIQAFDRLMGMPVTPDEKTPYLLTQLLAEVLLRRSFDGVRYRSSVSSGSNICVFHPAKFEFADGHSEVRRVASVRYEAPAVPSLIEPTFGDAPICGRN
jgi:hypothetical protein